MSRVFYCLFIFSIDFLLAMFVAGQENYAVKTFTTDHGLPHNHVRSIAQDQNGFLWIATWDGLSRYDGYEFRNYYHNPQDTNSLIYFTAEQVLVDCTNQVWVMAASSGVSLYNRRNDDFIQIDGSTKSMDIVLDLNKKLWWLTKNQIQIWDYELKQFVSVEVVTADEKLSRDMFVSLNFDNRGGIWLECVDAGGKSYFLYCNDSSVRPLQFKFLGRIPETFRQPMASSSRLSIFPLVTSTGSYVVNNNYRLYQLDLADQTFKIREKPFNENEWHGTPEEYRTDFLQKMKFYNENLKLADGITDYSFIVESHCADYQGTNWFSIVANTREALGLTRAIPNPKWFRHYFTDFKNNGRLNAIFPVLKDRFGTLWAGPQNKNGLFRMEKDGKCYEENIISQQLKENVWGSRVFFEDEAGIWIGYYNNLLQFFDFQQQKYTTVFLKKNGQEDISLPGNIIHIVRDGKDLILFDYIAAYRFNLVSGKCRQLYSTGNKVGIYSVWHADNGDWWLGFGAGKIGHFNRDFQLIKEYIVGNGKFNIEFICPGYNNDLWLSTLGGGLVHFDSTTGKSKSYTTVDGLSNNTCYGMLKDKHGNLWVTTNHGISRFNPKTEQFRTFGPTDGLKIDEFNSDNTYLAPDGEMFFGGMGGVVSFYPDSLADTGESHIISPLVIEDFKVSGTNRYFSKAICECDTVTLFKGDTNFQLTFACLDFKNADEIKYRYRLEGEDRDFVQTDSRHRFLNYASLSPGKYKLLIEATNLDGDWASRTSLLVIIPAYFYQTAWFKLLFTVFLLLSAGHFVYSYNHRIRLKAKQQQEELRLESLRGQMNPHFIFNSLNSINYFISQNDRLSANRYIADFSRLIRSILGNMSNEYISLTLELESLHDYLKLEHLRFGDKFDYTIQVYEGISPEELLVFPGMVQPFIENAIWHGVRGLEGRKGMVNIEFRLANKDCLICVVEDDGIGRIRSEKCKSNLPGKTSRGINIVLERLKIINNLRQTNFQVKIDDLFNDREETGTRVIIEIPVKI